MESKEWKWTEPCVIKKAVVEMVKWNQLEKGDYILFSNIPVRVFGPPKAPNQKVKVSQWEDFTMELGPWSHYYKVVEGLEDSWLCPTCFHPVEKKKAICKDCQEMEKMDENDNDSEEIEE